MQPAPEPATPRSRLPFVIIAVVVVIAVALGVAIAKGVLFGSSTEPDAASTSTAEPGSDPSRAAATPSPRTPDPSRTPVPGATAARPGAGTDLTLPVTYQVPGHAKMSRTQLLRGYIQLSKTKDQLVMDFDYNRAKPTQWINDERSYAAKNHVPIRPLQVDGGSGFAYDGTSQGKTYANYVVARGGITIRVWAQGSSSGTVDPALKRQAEQVIASVRFEPSSLMQPSNGSSSGLRLPFRYAPPPALGHAPKALLTSHLVDYLVSGGQYAQVSATLYNDVAQARKYYDQKKSQLQKTSAGQQGKLRLKDLRTEPSTRTTIGRQVDEGYGFVTRQQGIGDMLLFFTARKGNTLITVRADGGDRELQQVVQDTAIGALVTMRFPR